MRRLASGRDAALLVIVTPGDDPSPGDQTNVLNRLVLLMLPALAFQQGRTRARLRDGVWLRTFALVCTCGWWAEDNAVAVARVVEASTQNASVAFVARWYDRTRR